MSDWSSDVCSSDLWADEASVEESYAGQAVAVAADPTAIRAEERPWDETAKRHWFWSEVRRMRRSFYPVLGAALMINLLGFALPRSEEHTSELQSLMRISYAVFCLKKKNKITSQTHLA